MTRRGYKITQIGEIPEEWKLGSLASVSENENGIVAGPFGSNLKVSDYTDVGVPIIRLQNIATNLFVYKDIKYISEEKAEELSYHSFMAGDIVLAKLGDPIGIACIIPPELPHGIVVADVVRIRVFEKKANKHFVVQILNSPICLQQLKSAKIGSTRPRVNLSNVRNIKLILPSLKEQQKIAEILSSMDEAIQRVNEQITKTERLKKGLMQTLLTKGIGHTKFKRTEISEIPDNWNVEALGSMIEIMDSRRVPLSETQRENKKGTIPYCGANGVIDYIDDYIFEEEAVLLAEDGGNYGKYQNKAYIMTGKYWVNNHAHIFRGRYELLENKFIVQWLNFAEIGPYVSGTTRTKLNQEMLKSILVPIPPLSEQQKIAEILSNIDLYTGSLENYKTKLNSLKKGLMQDLLTGKVRVNNLKGVLNINDNTV